MAQKETRIKIDVDVVNRLIKHKEVGITYSEIITKLLDNYEDGHNKY